MRPTVAVLSTWQEICGIAHYTHFLRRALESKVDVTIIPTPRAVFLADNDPAEITQAETYLDQIISRLRDFDHVNIQFEPGIYSRRRPVAFRRIERIVEAAKDVSLSFHTVERRGYMPARYYLGKLSNFRVAGAALVAYQDWRRERDWNRLYRAILKKSRSGRVAVIAHTKRDAHLLRGALPGVAVEDTPLTFIDERYRADMRRLAAASRLPRRLPPPDPSKRYVGLFGFVNEYKGFDMAFEAMSYLPDEYEMLAFISVHEGMLRADMKSYPYLKRLVAQVAGRPIAGESAKPDDPDPVPAGTNGRPITDRVHFIGAVGDDDLILGMMLCDAVLFPYINSQNHTASGPISLAIETDRHVLASRNTAFLELARYFPDAFEFFDIGNSLEMAQKIVRARRFIEREEEVAGMRWVHFPPTPRPYDSETTAEIYLRAFGFGSSAPRVAAE